MLENIEILWNLFENLILGFSEVLILNGNVKDFIVNVNIIWNVDNIGIDVIGFEKVVFIEKYDWVCEGFISENYIYNVSSYLNFVYKYEYFVGGIYVDGGKDVIIEYNVLSYNDLGIEIVSEYYGK